MVVSRYSILVACLLLAACHRAHDPTACGSPSTAIGAIQGAGDVSPLVGETVVVEGGVTARFGGTASLGGFVLQSLEQDNDPRTSDGIWVAARFEGLDPGQRIRLRGTVAELDGTTALIPVGGHTVCGLAAAGPRRVSLAETPDLESLEAQRVQIEEPLTIADTYALGQRGRLVTRVGYRGWAETNDAGKDRPPTRSLTLDDASVLEPAPVMPLIEGESPPRVGDRLINLQGVLLQDTGGYVLHHEGLRHIEALNPRPAAPPQVGGSLSVATMNILNFFATLGERGAETEVELERQQAKVVAALGHLDADLVALVEIENGGPALARLVTVLNDLSADPYRAVGDPEAPVGGDEIRVAFVYRPSRFEIVGPQRVLDDPVFRDRPMVAQTFREKGGGALRFTAVAAHWKSKGGCDHAEGPDRDQGDGQGCWNDLRVREARRTVDLIQEIAESVGDDRVLLLGDLNAYGEEDPLGMLREAGLVDLVARFVEDPYDRYSFVYRGRAGRLDHAFATPSLAGSVTGAGYWHINADEARALDYRSENPEELYRPDPFRSSDHDPLLVGIDR